MPRRGPAATSARWNCASPSAATGSTSCAERRPGDPPRRRRPAPPSDGGDVQQLRRQIVRENAVPLGRDAEAAILSESAAWLKMRKRRARLRRPAPGDPRGGAQHASSTARCASPATRVDNLADLDDIAAFPEAFADVLERPSDSPRVTCMPRSRRRRPRSRGSPVLADLARAYNSEKRRLGVLDFSDQVAGALGVVRAHAAVGEELRSRYRVVLLDEYQDTSVVQTDLLAALFHDTAVMAVGDPHQSIYGWRGASAGNLGGFAAAFAPDGGSREFALMTSWRNSAVVLDAANAVLRPLAATSPVPVRELRAAAGCTGGRARARLRGRPRRRGRTGRRRGSRRCAGARAAAGPVDDGRGAVPQQAAHGAVPRGAVGGAESRAASWVSAACSRRPRWWTS